MGIGLLSNRVRASYAILAGYLFAAGCYSPAVDACRLACAGTTCPSGLTCNLKGMCTNNRDDVCAPFATDAPRADASCGWLTSNVDACALRAEQAVDDVILPANMRTIFMTTETPSVPTAFVGGGRVSLVPQLNGGPQVVVFSVHNLTIDGSMTVNGPLPLVILASGDVTIMDSNAGPAIVVAPFGADPVCTGGDGTPTSLSFQTAAGGGGGGFGEDGAPGGMGGGTASGSGAPMLPSPGMAGAAAGRVTLTPLLPGCPGGRGGTSPNNTAGSSGGRGGGAIQISARGTIRINGTIAAGGTGGQGGGGAAAGAGGGAGGAILLEAPMVIVRGRLCANGGGGGGALGGALGSAGLCSYTPAPGGNMATLVLGGDGGAAGTPPTVGKMGNSQEGAGGGGGGVGRIRLNGIVDVGVPTNVTVTPVASVGPLP